MTKKRAPRVSTSTPATFAAVAGAFWLSGQAAALAQSQDAIPAIGTAALPRDLSLVGMFTSADIIVKAVIVGLAFASVVTWTVALTKTIQIYLARRHAVAAFASLASARTLGDAKAIPAPLGELVEAAFLELARSADAVETTGLRDRIGARLERIEAACGRRILRGTGVLATIGATAPFVGLFGTVWGVMNSFIGISKAATTNLAVVAPGIAEALLATAFGLAAAIPAVVIYNLFARMIASYRAQLSDASTEVQRLVSRDLDRGVSIASVPLSTAAE